MATVSGRSGELKGRDRIEEPEHRLADRSSKKDAAVSFLRLAASGRVRQAYAKYVAPGFRHHNPFFAGGADALIAGMEENARQNPHTALEIQRALEEGDLVAVHSRVRQKPGDAGAALVRLFRFESDRVVEMWDVGQPVPVESVNQRGMF